MLSMRQKSIVKWFIYPSLYDRVIRLLEVDDLYLDFYESDQSGSCDEMYDINTIGRFIYRNP